MVTNQTNHKWLWRIMLTVLIVFIAGTGFIFYKSMHPYNALRTEAEKIATKSADASDFDGFWWNTRDKSYLTLSAKRKNKPVYVVIARKTGKVNVVLQASGSTRNSILRKVWNKYNPKRVLNAGLRLHKKRLVWDVGFIDKSGNLGYASYDYRTGNLIKVISDL